MPCCARAVLARRTPWSRATASGILFAVPGRERDVRRVTLFNTGLLDVRVGVFRRRPIIDHASGQRIGFARRPFGLGFRLSDEDDRVVLRVIGGLNRSWNVLGPNGAQVGSIVPALRQTKRGRWVRETNDSVGPSGWAGSVLLDNEEAAIISGGVVADPATRRQLAALHRVEDERPIVWRLSISDRVEGPLRVMALAWLGVAFDLQRSADAAAG